MIEVIANKSEDINRNDLMEFLILRSKRNPESIPSKDVLHKYVDNLLANAKYHLLAYVNDEISGWLGLIKVNPSLMILYEWHPLVMSGENKKTIVQELLYKAFQFTRNKGISNVRVFVDVVKQREEQFQELQILYESVKMEKTHICYCMEHTLSESDIKNIQLPPEITITRLGDKSQEELLNCYNRVFENSLDDFINSLDREEQSYWDFFNLGAETESSIGLEHNGDIIGFIGARDYGEYMEFGPVGILPEYRGRGLSKILMDRCFSNLIKLDKRNGYIEVGVRNEPAINLYSAYGFKEVSKKHGFVKRLKQENT
ncbi:MAG: GNAT family N-acetyltransferase [Candidatus Heimdallarchaeota archaeon]|nr:MAG: GNAT family N-acetyltransferase [Candidatus Heimdallarchaeota archaeon]